ncbi:hypothetical protein ACIRCZ_18975 [Leifsonia sp. NPDC102414]|uniref:hypothetical protein n=1 Tax=Leifsonia sp. NPDC102414 TaxID=3364124 RepID=UPI0037F34971
MSWQLLPPVRKADTRDGDATMIASPSIGALEAPDLLLGDYVVITRIYRSDMLEKWLCELHTLEFDAALCVDELVSDAGIAPSDVLAITTDFYRQHHVFIAAPWNESKPDTFVARITPRH